MPEHSAISVASLGDLVEEQGALPGFVVQRADGLYVLRSRLDSPAAFVQFVNRVIDAGLYFHNLDYARFVELLYDEKAREPAEVFLASGVRPFDPVRRTLYHSLRADKDEATFLFEPIHALDDEGAHKNRPSGGHQHDGERIILDIDEFIAYAWAEGVRYGIDLAAVNEGFELGKPEKRVVARSLPAQAGKDAEIRELAPGLHRNNAPRRMVSGRVDLRQFETRYPQVAASLRLVQKVPRKPGIDGRLISGEVVPASPAKDFELASLAGPGTQVKREKDVEFLVSSVCGFLSVDTQTNQFSVGDKIVSHEGVSTRTT
ncbi:MAG TPA: FapA family protein, partial [Accumulibacter sp.]|nr:FapA family protein [Accumulibacter sp.]